MRQTMRERWRRRAAQVVTVGASLGALSACDSLLEVDLPHLLTDAAIGGAGTAEAQVYSAIALFECGYSTFGNTALGHEDAMESIAGVFGGGHIYDATPNDGLCGDASTDQSWFDQIIGARAMLATQPARLVPTATGTVTSDFPVGRGVYDRIQDEFSLGQSGERLSAIAATYVAMSLGHMGEFLCEAAIDGSELLTPPEVLDLAETWANSALGHVTNFGDFVMPFGIAPSARDMVTAVRARIRWANGDLAGADADAAAVLAADADFAAFVTREGGDTRRNHIYHNATEIGFSGMLGVNTWWNPASRRPNPTTGTAWPDPIPFTGYIFLAVMPDGRTLEAGNIPVRWAEEQRDVNEDPVSLGNTAVPDTRVSHIYKEINGPGKHELPDRYTGLPDDIPYMTWEELVLIQADYQLSLGAAANLQNAIDLVNTLRTDKSLPVISGVYLTTLTDGANDAAEVRAMLLEERRREFFAEGARYWSTKIQNTDLLWFPRGEGRSPFRSYNLDGGVRQTFHSDEYDVNPHWVAAGGLDLRGTGCDDELAGSQQPYIN